MSRVQTVTRDDTVVLLEAKAEEAARLLMAMGNAKRLLVLCTLVEGERSAGDLAQTVGLSHAALSQHLGRMRDQGLVESRRDGQMILYRLASDRVRVILDVLCRMFCGEEGE